METPKILQRCLRAAARTQVTRNATRRQQSQLQSTQTIRRLQSTRTTLTAGPPLRHFSSSIIARSEVAAEAKDTEKPAADAQDAAKPDPVAAELEAKKKEVVDLNDKWRRSVAEYRNLQDQTKREVQKAKDFALERFSRDLIDSIDNLDRALGTVDPKSFEASADSVSADTTATVRKDLKNLYEGLQMTERIMLSTLKKHGLERFDPAQLEDGEMAVKFDPNRHEATFQAPQADKEDGTVFHCQSKGFALNGRVLRAAKVGVVKNS